MSIGRYSTKPFKSGSNISNSLSHFSVSSKLPADLRKTCKYHGNIAHTSNNVTYHSTSSTSSATNAIRWEHGKTRHLIKSYCSIAEEAVNSCDPLLAYTAQRFLKSTDVQSYRKEKSSQEDSSGQRPGFQSITEGEAIMSYAENEEVFYNRVQIFNRDFSILVIRHFIKIREEESRRNQDKKLEPYRGTEADQKES